MKRQRSFGNSSRRDFILFRITKITWPTSFYLFQLQLSWIDILIFHYGKQYTSEYKSFENLRKCNVIMFQSYITINKASQNINFRKTYNNTTKTEREYKFLQRTGYFSLLLLITRSLYRKKYSFQFSEDNSNVHPLF